MVESFLSHLQTFAGALYTRKKHLSRSQSPVSLQMIDWPAQIV